jgi:hypothetical protein
MSLEITYVQNFLVKDYNLLKLLLVVFGFGSQTFICGFSRQNICSVVNNVNAMVFYPRYGLILSNIPRNWIAIPFGRRKILQINSSECWTVLIHTSDKRPSHSLSADQQKYPRFSLQTKMISTAECWPIYPKPETLIFVVFSECPNFIITHSWLQTAIEY